MPAALVIPRTHSRAKPNSVVDGEDVSRAVVMRGRGPKVPITSTSSKAMMLRHDDRIRRGICGEGKLTAFKKLSGQEKLALKAEEVTRNAAIPSFNLDRLHRTAIGQFGGQIDKIRELRDVETFYDTVNAYIESHPRHKPHNVDKLSDFLTRVIGSRIHNAYLLAATWKIIRDALRDLKERDLNDLAVRDQLKSDDNKRDSYLLVWDCVSMLLDCALQELKADVAGSDALGKYFATTDAGVAAFSPTEALLMSAHRSLIDATILELVLPHSTYSPHILFAILSDALSTTPHEEVRKFSQAIVDNLGNLSILIEMRNMLEGPLLAAGKEGRAWKDAPRRVPEEEVDAFYDAIQKSATVGPLKANRWRHLVSPLNQTKSETVLQELWKAVDAAYLDVTSYTVDELWRLEADRNPRPQWSTWDIPELADYEDISSEDEQIDGSCNSNGAAGRGSKGKSRKQQHVRPDALVRKKRTRQGGANPYRQAITAGQGDDDGDDIPELMSCSSSSDFDTSVEDGGEKNSDSEWGSDVESNYGSHEKTVLERLMKEAQDASSAAWNSGTGKKDNNPFIRLLSNLRGRMFDTDPTLRPSKMGPQAPAANHRPPSATVTARMQLQTNKFSAPEMPDPAVGKKSQPLAPGKRNKEKEEDDLPLLVGEEVRVKATNKAGAAATENGTPSTPLPKAPTVPTAAGKVTITEADGEEDVENEEAKKAEKKRNKKRPKKKKTSPTPQQAQTTISPNGRTTSSTQTPPTPSVRAHPTINLSAFSGSSISLAQPVPLSAQSARAYIASKGLDAEPKGKTKTRAGPSPSSEQPPKEKKNGFFAHFTRKHKEREKEKEEKENEDEEDGEKQKGKVRSGLHLPRKAASLIGRVLGGKADVKKGQAGMKWEHFVKAMKLLGFREVRGTEGSSVRFDPPSDLDHPITFHKPHPDSTIHPKMLIKFGKRLKAHYGWDEEQFTAAVKPDVIDDDLD